MGPRNRSLRILAATASAATVALIGCGGSSGGNAAVSPRAAFRCLTGSGLRVKSIPPPPNVESAMTITTLKGTVTVWFLGKSSDATVLSKHVSGLYDQAGQGGSARVVGGTAVVGEVSGGNNLDPIEHCVTG